MKICATSCMWRIYLQEHSLTVRDDWLWIYWRRNATVLTPTQSWCTAACLLPSPPTWSCDCRHNSWHYSYKIKALGCQSKESQSAFSSRYLSFSFFFDSFFDFLDLSPRFLSSAAYFSCPCFAVSLFVSLPVSIFLSLYLTVSSFSFWGSI